MQASRKLPTALGPPQPSNPYPCTCAQAPPASLLGKQPRKRQRRNKKQHAGGTAAAAAAASSGGDDAAPGGGGGGCANSPICCFPDALREEGAGRGRELDMERQAADAAQLQAQQRRERQRQQQHKQQHKQHRQYTNPW